MAISRAESQITWSAANSVSVAAGGAQTSDALTLPTVALAGSISLKADHSGTPAAGNTVEFYALYSNGDPDGTGTDEYDTTEQGTLLAVLDLNADDPAQTTVPLPVVSAKALKIYAVNNDTGDTVTASATCQFIIES